MALGSLSSTHPYPPYDGPACRLPPPNSQLLGQKEGILGVFFETGVQRFSWQHTQFLSVRIRGALPSKHESNDFPSSLHQPDESPMQSHRVQSSRSRAGDSPALTASRSFAALRAPPARALEQESGGTGEEMTLSPVWVLINDVLGQ